MGRASWLTFTRTLHILFALFFCVCWVSYLNNCCVTCALFFLTVYKLITYCLYHKNMTSFFLNAVVMVYPCIGLEKGIGTIRFLYQSLLLTSISGLLHVLLDSLLSSPSNRSSVNGFIPLALSVLGLVTINSAMRKAYFMGINVPSASLPWIILIIVTVAFPNTVFLCNVLAIITGISCILAVFKSWAVDCRIHTHTFDFTPYTRSVC